MSAARRAPLECSMGATEPELPKGIKLPESSRNHSDVVSAIGPADWAGRRHTISSPFAVSQIYNLHAHVRRADRLLLYLYQDERLQLIGGPCRPQRTVQHPLIGLGQLRPIKPFLCASVAKEQQSSSAAVIRAKHNRPAARSADPYFIGVEAHRTPSFPPHVAHDNASTATCHNILQPPAVKTVTEPNPPTEPCCKAQLPARERPNVAIEGSKRLASLSLANSNH